MVELDQSIFDGVSLQGELLDFFLSFFQLIIQSHLVFLSLFEFALMLRLVFEHLQQDLLVLRLLQKSLPSPRPRLQVVTVKGLQLSVLLNLLSHLIQSLLGVGLHFDQLHVLFLNSQLVEDFYLLLVSLLNVFISPLLELQLSLVGGSLLSERVHSLLLCGQLRFEILHFELILLHFVLQSLPLQEVLLLFRHPFFLLFEEPLKSLLHLLPLRSFQSEDLGKTHDESDKLLDALRILFSWGGVEQVVQDGTTEESLLLEQRGNSFLGEGKRELELEDEGPELSSPRFFLFVQHFVFHSLRNALH